MALPAIFPTKENLQTAQLEETRQESNSKKRSSSVGAAFKRLFSKSPATAERSFSEVSQAISILGKETNSPQETGVRAGVRGRTPPKNSGSPLTPEYDKPNNPYYLPPNILTANNKGGIISPSVLIQQHAQQWPPPSRSASHRGGEMQLEYGSSYGYHNVGGTGGHVGVRRRMPLTDQGETHVIHDEIHGNYDRLHNTVPLTDQSAASASAQPPLEPPRRHNPDGTARSNHSASDPDQQRGDSRPTTTIIVNYTEPEGARYLVSI